MQEYTAMWKNYANFKDRTTVKGFWMAILINIIVSFVLGLLGGFSSALTILSGIYAIAAFIPSLAIEIRRLHDINKSGWWILLSLIPLVGVIVLIVWFCKGSVDQDNQYGTAQV